MKTLLFAPMYLDGNDLTGSSRLERNIKWLEYYIPLKEKLGVDDILLVDNNSSPENLKVLKAKFPEVSVKQNQVHLTRLTVHAYGYWYRAFSQAADCAISWGYEKMIHLDTDVYVLNDKFANHLKLIETGWTSFWSPIHKYPDATIQIICGDHVDKMKKFMSEDFLRFYPYEYVDDKMPLTHVDRSFNGDRWGDYDARPQDPSMDFYGQCPVSLKMEFNKK